MTVQEIIDSIEELPPEEQDYVLEVISKRRESQRGEHFWQGLEAFRDKIEAEGIVFEEEDFVNLRDKSLPRDVEL